MEMKKEEREARRVRETAFHEAGHAVMACLERQRFIRVTIVPEENTRGHIRHHRDPRKAERYEMGTVRLDTVVRELRVTIAGAEAQRRLTGRHSYGGQGLNRYQLGKREVFMSDPDGDGRRILDLIEYACGMGCPEAQAHFSSWVSDSVRHLIQSHWTWVEAVAGALLQRQTLTEDEVRALNPRAAELRRWEPEVEG
jgi:hypothetical protein